MVTMKCRHRFLPISTCINPSQGLFGGSLRDRTVTASTVVQTARARQQSPWTLQCLPPCLRDTVNLPCLLHITAALATDRLLDLFPTLTIIIVNNTRRIMVGRRRDPHHPPPMATLTMSTDDLQTVSDRTTSIPCRDLFHTQDRHEAARDLTRNHFPHTRTCNHHSNRTLLTSTATVMVTVITTTPHRLLHPHTFNRSRPLTKVRRLITAVDTMPRPRWTTGGSTLRPSLSATAPSQLADQLSRSVPMPFCHSLFL